MNLDKINNRNSNKKSNKRHINRINKLTKSIKKIRKKIMIGGQLNDNVLEPGKIYLLSPYNKQSISGDGN